MRGPLEGRTDNGDKYEKEPSRVGDVFSMSAELRLRKLGFQDEVADKLFTGLLGSKFHDFFVCHD
jgi:hypothetical protein